MRTLKVGWVSRGDTAFPVEKVMTRWLSNRDEHFFLLTFVQDRATLRFRSSPQFDSHMMIAELNDEDAMELLLTTPDPTQLMWM